MRLKIKWEPSDLFCTTRIVSYGASIYSNYTVYNYTKLGQWFEDMPDIFKIAKVPYYLIVVPVCVITKVCCEIINLFLPKDKKES